MSDAAELKSKLAEALARAMPGTSAICNLRRLSGGATQETWFFEALYGDRATPLILRRAPRAFQGEERQAIGLANEALLIGLAHDAGVPVPKIEYVLQPSDDMGEGFIAQFIDGETLGGKIARDPKFAEARKTLAHACGETAARIHTIPTQRLTMLKRWPPRVRFDELFRRYKTDGVPRPVFSLAFEWLRERIPPEPECLRLVHGDFRNGNLIVGPDGLRAVLDWELARIGDPIEDLGWMCVGSWRFGEIDKPAGGFGTREDLLAGYAAGGGAAPSREHLAYWEVFGSLNWGLMCSGMAPVFSSGLDPSIERAMIARRASETEIDLLNYILARS
ncbi:MAG TPA: phosphotransferase family protein [Rhizomicrobium sp.]